LRSVEPDLEALLEQLREKRNLKSFEPTLNKSHDLWFKLISPRLVTTTTTTTTTSSTSTANDGYHNDHDYRNSNGGGGSINSNGSNGGQ
jgi:hypothetical protein